ncbi:MAG: hypothetical protein RL347_44 [Actinomycetota bacterium]
MHVARTGGVNAYAPAVDEPISGAARFDALLAGIAAEMEAADAAALDADIAEVERAARAESHLLDRLRAQRQVSLELAEGGMVSGLVAAVGRDVVVLAADDGDWAIPVWGISAVVNPDDGVEQRRTVSERLGLASVARSWSRQRSIVRVMRLAGAPLDGTIDAVGADHLDLAEHDPGEPRRADAVRRQVLVPLGAISAIRRR